MYVIVDALADILVLLYQFTVWIIKIVAEGLFLLTKMIAELLFLFFRIGGWIGEALTSGVGDSSRPPSLSLNLELAKRGIGRARKHSINEKAFVWGNLGSSSSVPEVDTSEWSLPLLRALEWKRWEEVVGHYYTILGYTSKVTRMGADGGVDVVLYQQGNPQPAIIVQCKAWSKKVGVKAVRELFGVMAADGIGYGIFATTSDYTKEAYNFAQCRPMVLMSGQGFM